MNYADLGNCGEALGQCMQNGDGANRCQCMGTYDKCLSSIDCSPTFVNNAVMACEESGCSSAQVRAGRRPPCCLLICFHNILIVYVRFQCSASAPAARRAQGGCTATGLQQCTSQFTNCSQYTPDKCDCSGQYDECVRQLGCSAGTIATVVKACEAAGCSTGCCTTDYPVRM
jgi:hypothetical protein